MPSVDAPSEISATSMDGGLAMTIRSPARHKCRPPAASSRRCGRDRALNIEDAGIGGVRVFLDDRARDTAH